MRSRWIAWSIVVCAAATAVHAEPPRRAGSPRAAARAEARGAPRSDEAAATPLAEAGAAKPKPKLKSRPRPSGRPRSGAKPRPGGRPKPEDLAPLTDDPLLARGDRIGGGEVKGMVAFTFDDGPSPETTRHVMDALKQYDVPATFFIVTRRLVGRRAAKNREVLGEQVAGGFQVASHSVSHSNLKHMSGKAVRREIDQSLRVLSKQAGHPIGLFRAPFGALDERGRKHLKKRGLTEVKWSIDPQDWRERDGDKLRERALATILENEGGVVLMHDIKEVTARSLAHLLDDLEAANCRRLADNKPPILPVSLHYWIRDNGKPRPVPDEVKQRTLAYESALPGRCAARAKPSP